MLKQIITALAFCAMPTLTLAEEGWPRQIEHEGGMLTLASPPNRIISTSPSLTGTLLAIEAPLVASATAVQGRLTDDTGFFRQWSKVAHARDLGILYRDLTFDIESVILQDPDLIVVSATGGDSALPFVPELEAMGFPVMVLNYGTNSWEALAEQLGRATGRESEAAEVAAQFNDRASKAGAEVIHPEGTVSIVSYNFFGTYGVSKPDSAQARVLRGMGFEVTGVPSSLQALVNRSREFDFVSHENLPAAISGDTIFLLAADEGDIETVMSDPVLANLPAVKAGRVYTLGLTSFRVDYYSGLAIIERVVEQFGK